MTTPPWMKQTPVTPARPLQEFDPNWPHGWVTRDGRKVTIYTTMAKGAKSIHGFIDGAVEPSGWCADGRTSWVGDVTDLINAPDPNAVKPIFEKRWVNVYENSIHEHWDDITAENGCGPYVKRKAVPCYLIECASMREIRDGDKTYLAVEKPNDQA